MYYGVSDFENIHAPYGILEDYRRLTDETYKRIIFDLVTNHTSDQHRRFQESRSSKTNLKRDWYFCGLAKYDKDGKRCPRNNWRSQFTVPPWVGWLPDEPIATV
jgi:oligo-1,6-glucosidase